MYFTLRQNSFQLYVIIIITNKFLIKNIDNNLFLCFCLFTKQQQGGAAAAAAAAGVKAEIYIMPSEC